ncbi:hypothetical protein COT93_02750 [Candidatus Falkowbacteria bacterium CG10_big_fil_rev_8_21_14_0_10_37_18]|uniref:Uncharacterized protein n=1 Tax=Candidatus Falkowbacteria bacterium CG10_big_fil_rev_8_21_14_0_10_37_18 TaxID=1974562 RepID=A0A2H0V8I4_9BACT|nr:MAG: hypothetical protein COT93_02750 [Candidatus Falkowbacteria bacterium CG10_big_fil_rev_8_21_14_0_10_37_18]
MGRFVLPFPLFCGIILNKKSLIFMAKNLDYQLLHRGGEDDKSAAKAGDLRAAQRSEQAPTPLDAVETLREVVLREKRKKEEQKKSGGAQSKIAGVMSSPIKLFTAKLLKQSWFHLADSFGLTLLYINIHAFLGVVLGHSMFCKLGEEWNMGDSMMGATKEGSGGQEMSGTVELMALGALDVMAILIIVAIFAVISLIINVIDNPLENISTIFGFLWGILTGSN